MNYASTYCALISKRLQNPITKGECYCEKHHIIPKSEGGDNSPDNLVNLTAREHYIAHLLLARIYNDAKMWCAIHRLVHGNRKSYTRITSRMYLTIKEHNSELTSLKFKGMKRGQFSTEHRRKLSEAHKGKPRPQSWLNKMRGRPSWNKGKTGIYTKETRMKMGEKNKGMYLWSDGTTTVKQKECPMGFHRGRK